MTRPTPRLATRLMVAQALVVGIGALALVLTAVVVAPGLFHEHLMQVGVNDSDVVVRPGPRMAEAARIMARCLVEKAP